MVVVICTVSSRAAAYATRDLNAEITISNDPVAVLAADRVIFPGQGAMPDCMKNLSESGLERAVRTVLKTKPVLAICIGLQTLFDFSEEGNIAGLGIYPGRVKRFPTNMQENGVRLKVPQMGWNRVKGISTSSFMAGYTRRCVVLFCAQLLC